MFLDHIEIEVEAGSGGQGCFSFRREKFVPKGGPDGGDGGNGGSVILQAEAGVDHLNAFVHQKHWRAERGKAGGPANRKGRNGQDLLLKVPPGTLIRDADEGFVIKDLTQEGEQVIIAQGGRGGFGNTHFKSSTNRAPRQTTPGQEGESKRILLELKVIADVGLLGKPNAGKSTLLSRVSRARPEIANYPFTTKYPHLGMVQVDLERSFVMADIPGLIEGAHQGAGLGHEFLRHIERAGILVHLVEPEPLDGTEAWENYQAIRHEISMHSEELGARPELVAITKQDLPAGKVVREQFEEKLGRKVWGISAVTGEGLNQLLRAILHTLDEQTKVDSFS
ncbi:GTP-binding protein Obg [Planctomycetales bacterium 10988]|nr:GTP-binding protein Obg [Planctomycetales bacterium 10988]